MEFRLLASKTILRGDQALHLGLSTESEFLGQRDASIYTFGHRDPKSV